MISLGDSRIQRGGLDERIEKWVVWFRTPWGLCETLHEACEVMKKNELDPDMGIIPVPVAVSNATHEVFFINGNG